MVPDKKYDYYIFPVIATTLLGIFIIQIATDKFGSSYYKVLLWFIVTILPIFYLYWKRCYKNHQSTKRFLFGINCYVVLLLIFYLLDPLYYPFLEVDFLTILSYSLLLIIPFQAYLFYGLLEKPLNSTLLKKIRIPNTEQEKVLESIQNGLTEDAFERLDTFLDSLPETNHKLVAELAIIQNKWNFLKRQERLGLASFEELSIENAKINNSLIEFLSHSFVD